MVRTSLAEDIGTTYCAGMASRLTDFEFLSATCSFASVCVVFVVGVVTHFTDAFGSRAGGHVFL
jgi:hypothetical protein